MAINYIVGDKLIANTSYAALNSLDLLATTREALGKATGTNLVFSVLQVGTVFGGPTLSTLFSFIRVLPLNRLGEADIRSLDYQDGRGVILYFTSDTSLNDSFEKPGSYTPDIQYLGCINKTGVTILKGKVVRQAAFDATSQLPTVTLAAATSANLSHWLGISAGSSGSARAAPTSYISRIFNPANYRAMYQDRLQKYKNWHTGMERA